MEKKPIKNPLHLRNFSINCLIIGKKSRKKRFFKQFYKDVEILDTPYEDVSVIFAGRPKFDINIFQVKEALSLFKLSGEVSLYKCGYPVNKLLTTWGLPVNILNEGDLWGNLNSVK